MGCAVAAQSARIVPLDGALYALRDATATVPSVPLIAASVMSKKLAVQTDLILLDVKVGSGAFAPETLGDAEKLARACLQLAHGVGRVARAAVTDMSQPLGDAVGNALDVVEAVEVLRGTRRGRLRDLVIAFTAEALVQLDGSVAPGEAIVRAERALDDGSALERFRLMVAAQGGDPRVVDDPTGVLPRAPVAIALRADRDGILAQVRASEIGLAAGALGAGRARKGDAVDPAVGIVLRPKIGDRLGEGEPIGPRSTRGNEEAAAAASRPGARSPRWMWWAARWRRAPLITHGWTRPKGGDVGRFTGESLRLTLYLGVSLFIALDVREYARAVTATRLHDPTPRLWGRLGLRPKGWFEPFGSGLLPGLILLLWAAATVYPPMIAYAKPAPIDPSYFRRFKRDSVVVGLAGPATNIAVAVAAGLLLRVGLSGEVGRALGAFAFANLCMAFFHLLPIPGLDGRPARGPRAAPPRGGNVPQRGRVPPAVRPARDLLPRDARELDRLRAHERCLSRVVGQFRVSIGWVRALTNVIAGMPRAPGPASGERYHRRHRWTASGTSATSSSGRVRVITGYRPTGPLHGSLGRQHREHASPAGRPGVRLLLLHRRLAHAHHALRPHRRTGRRGRGAWCWTGSRPASTPRSR